MTFLNLFWRIRKYAYMKIRLLGSVDSDDFANFVIAVVIRHLKAKYCQFNIISMLERENCWNFIFCPFTGCFDPIFPQRPDFSYIPSDFPKYCYWTAFNNWIPFIHDIFRLLGPCKLSGVQGNDFRGDRWLQKNDARHFANFR